MSERESMGEHMYIMIQMWVLALSRYVFNGVMLQWKIETWVMCVGSSGRSYLHLHCLKTGKCETELCRRREGKEGVSAVGKKLISIVVSVVVVIKGGALGNRGLEMLVEYSFEKMWCNNAPLYETICQT